MAKEAILGELEGLRVLARALVAGDADADDLIQDAALAALEHPPALDRPVRPWLAAVLRNRRRMDLRTAARRADREAAAAPAEAVEPTVDRARTLERLSAALVALEEPFRTTVIRRYLDGESAATIARDLGVPPGTVRSRLKTGLDRLRAALDETSPRWRRAWIPIAPSLSLAKGALVVKKLAFVLLLLCLLAGGGWLWRHPRRDATTTAPTSAMPSRRPIVVAPLGSGARSPDPDPLPGQGRVTVAAVPTTGGVAGGRVINWSTGEGVAGAELTFAGEAGAITVHSDRDGGFELAPPAPPAPGDFTLATIAATGFLPYAPEYLHSQVHFALAKDRVVRGLTVFLFPALDYYGHVVDANGAPAAGAHVRLLGTPAGEQTIDRLATEWTSARDGSFTFHAADDAMFEAVRGSLHGWARLDGNVALTHQLVIKLGNEPAHDATITGRVVDEAGHPLPDVLVRALPFNPPGPPRERAASLATTGADGTFAFEHLDRQDYDLVAEDEGRASAHLRTRGGASNLTLALATGIVLAGTVTSSSEDPIAAFTLTVARRDGASRSIEVARSIVDPRGQFEVHVAPGDVELVASAAGWAPSAPAHVVATSAVNDLHLVVTAGATLKGAVLDAADRSPLPYVRIMREGRGGGASAQPANAGTVTRSDGTFELTGIPPGPVAITVGGSGYHPRIESGMTARDGEVIGPIEIQLTKLAPGEQPSLELIGIGVKLVADGEVLRVDTLIPGGGAAAAGIVVGDHIVAVDGTSTSELGLDGAISKIRGAVGTTVAISVQRGDQVVALSVERRKLRA